MCKHVYIYSPSALGYGCDVISYLCSCHLDFLAGKNCNLEL